MKFTAPMNVTSIVRSKSRLGHVLERPEDHRRGVGDRDVQAAPLALDARDRRGDRVLVAEVGRDDERAAAVLAHAEGDAVEPVGVARQQRDVRAGARERTPRRPRRRRSTRP
jgi:hypothetical protein